MLRGVLKDTLVYSAASFIARGVGFFLIPVYTRYLAPADYGRIDLLTIFLSVSAAVFGGQLYQGVARFLPEMSTDEEKALCASTTLWTVALAFLLFAAVGLALSGSIGRLLLGSESEASLVRLAIPWIAVSSLLEICQSQLRFDLKAGQYATVSVVVVCVSIGMTLLLVAGQRMGVRGFVLGQLAGSASGLALSYAFARSRYRLTVSVPLLKKLLLFSVPLIPSTLSVLIWNSIDRFFISNYLDMGQVGIYGIGVRFASIASMLIMGLNLAITPIIFANYRKAGTPGELARLFSILVLGVTPLVTGAILLSREVLMLMTTEMYYGAAPLIPLLMTGVLMSQLYNFAPGVFIAKKTYLVTAINLAACAFSLGANLVLVPRLGILGAGIANAANGLLVFLLYVLLGRRYYRVPFHPLDLAISGSTLAAAWIVSHLLFPSGEPFRWSTAAIKLGVVVVLSIPAGLLVIRRVRERVVAGASPAPGDS